MVPAFAEIAAADRAGRSKIYRDDSWRQQAAEEIDSGKYIDIRWDSCIVTETEDSGALGSSLQQLAQRRDSHPLETALDIALADNLTSRFTVNFANDDEEAVACLLREPGVSSACRTPAHTSARFAMP